MNNIKIHFWSERIDDKMWAVHATVRYVTRGYLHGLTVFVLVDHDVMFGWDRERQIYAHHALAKERMHRVLAHEHGGFFPIICAAYESVGPQFI